jgi:hypothetical protein
MTGEPSVATHALPLSVWVAGVPKTKGSLRVRARRANGGVLLAEQVTGSSDWRARIVETVLRQGGADFAPGGPIVPWASWTGPVGVRLLVRVSRPVSGAHAAHAWPDYLRTGDLDKYARNVGDALTDTRIIADDGQIVHWDAWKVWAEPSMGRHSGVWIEVAAL